MKKSKRLLQMELPMETSNYVMDFNILIRILVRDDTRLVEMEKSALGNNVSKKNPGFVPLIVCCESDLVLCKSYKYTRAKMVSIFEGLLKVEIFDFEKAHIISSILPKYLESDADLADLINSKVAQAYSCKEVLTLDKKVAQCNGLKLIS